MDQVFATHLLDALVRNLGVPQVVELPGETSLREYSVRFHSEGRPQEAITIKGKKCEVGTQDNFY